MDYIELFKKIDEEMSVLRWENDNRLLMNW